MTLKDRDEFFARLGQAMPDKSAYAVALTGHRLILAAGKHLRACEGDCSIPAPDGDYGNGLDVPGYWGKRQRAALELARKWCPDGWTIKYQNDPRGGTLWLQRNGTGEDSSSATRIDPPAAGFPASVYERRGA